MIAELATILRSVFPKSVSLYVAMSGDRQVERMIMESFRETMTLIENAMQTRVRGKGRDGVERDCDRCTSNMMYAAFVHRETRPVEGISDPHFHIHAFVFNATWDQEETRWKAVQFGNTKPDAPFYEAGFHSLLASKLLEAGYAIRRTERDFELACVSRELIGKFSKRTALIEQIFREEYIVIEAEARALAKRTKIDFFDAVAEVKGALGSRTRERKSQRKLAGDELLNNWRSQMTPEELASLSPEAVRAALPENLLETDTAKGLAIQHLFERVSVVRELHATAMLLRRGIGGVSIDEALEFARRDLRLLRAGGALLQPSRCWLRNRRCWSASRPAVGGMRRFVAVVIGRSFRLYSGTNRRKQCSRFCTPGIWLSLSGVRPVAAKP
jgi:hypothetical protein